jgi:hypothetical protein
MKQSIHIRLALGIALLGACQQPSKQSASSKGNPEDALNAPPVSRAWTDAFVKKAILFADEIVVEGPQGIINHTVVRVEPDIHEFSTRTTPEGLLQGTRLKPGAGGEVHAGLDNWELIGFRQITILERVAPCDVHVRARGDVRFVDQTTKEERHGAELGFEGKIPR